MADDREACRRETLEEATRVVDEWNDQLRMAMKYHIPNICELHLE